MYRSKSFRNQATCAKCNSRLADNEHSESEQRRTNDADDELELTEEGIGLAIDENICSICIEPFHVGEQVTWSKMGNCRHFFHYECILPWAVLGHEECPVCREKFWTKGMDPCFYFYYYFTEGSGSSTTATEMRRSRFCVEHGLVSPSRSIHDNQS